MHLGKNKLPKIIIRMHSTKIPRNTAFQIQCSFSILLWCQRKIFLVYTWKEACHLSPCLVRVRFCRIDHQILRRGTRRFCFVTHVMVNISLQWSRSSNLFIDPTVFFFSLVFSTLTLLSLKEAADESTMPACEPVSAALEVEFISCLLLWGVVLSMVIESIWHKFTVAQISIFLHHHKSMYLLRCFQLFFPDPTPPYCWRKEWRTPSIHQRLSLHTKFEKCEKCK